MKTTLFIATFLFSLLCFAGFNDQLEKAKWIATTQTRNKAILDKVDQNWVGGCLNSTVVYIGKNRKINDGLTPQFNAETVCALVSDKVIEHIKSGKNLKFQGCIDGIGVVMEMFDKTASNQKRKEVMAEYCI
jgi:hypothetical protein